MQLVSERWAQVEPTLRDRAYKRIDDMPELLLEHDAWFTLDADIIYARMFGFEDEIVEDRLRLTKVEPAIFMPIFQSTTRMIQEATDAAFLDKAGIFSVDMGIAPMRAAEYRLQSCFVTMSVSGMHDPPVEQLRDDGTVTVAYLRYRRRS